MEEQNPNNQQNNQQDDEERREQNPGTRKEESTFSQEDVNRFIAKERRKWEREQAKQSNLEAKPASPQGQEGAPPAESAELQEANRKLITMRAQLEAMRSGVRAEVVEDAVMLALHDVEKSGEEPDEDNVKDALESVLKRHPGWKEETGKQGGIKVGAQQSRTEEPGAPIYNGVTCF